MTHSEIAARMLRRQEGLRLEVYDDATGAPLRPGSTLIGHPTIGYGRALDVRGISQDEAEYLLANDLATAERIATTFADTAWSELTPTRKAVLMSMAHQLGERGLGSFAQLHLAVVTGDHAGAAAQILDSKLAREDAPARAREYAELMLVGADLEQA
jgi:lysozyme